MGPALNGMADLIEQTDVAVVGAGGGGAVLALALAKQGISTVVLVRATCEMCS